MMDSPDRWATLQLTVAGHDRQVALVLDASESAASHRHEMISRAASVLDALPASSVSELYFLGNPSPYSSREFSTKCTQWFAENRGRARLLGPLMRRFIPRSVSTIALIVTGPVFDLEDWLELDSVLQFVILPVEQLLQDYSSTAVTIAHDHAHLVRLLHDPLVSASISGRGLVPFEWDNSTYRIQLTDGRLLLASQEVRTLDVNAKCLFFDDDEASCSAVSQSGRSLRFPVPLIREGSSGERNATTLTELEADIFHRASRRTDFLCPYCHSKHAWHLIRCPDDAAAKYRFQGRPLYPSLEDSKLEGLVVCRQQADGRVLCDTSSRAAVRIANNRVVAILEGRLRLLDYSRRSATWQPSLLQPQRYIQIPGNRYVLDYR